MGSCHARLLRALTHQTYDTTFVVRAERARVTCSAISINYVVTLSNWPCAFTSKICFYHLCSQSTSHVTVRPVYRKLSTRLCRTLALPVCHVPNVTGYPPQPIAESSTVHLPRKYVVEFGDQSRRVSSVARNAI